MVVQVRTSSQKPWSFKLTFEVKVSVFICHGCLWCFGMMEKSFMRGLHLATCFRYRHNWLISGNHRGNQDARIAQIAWNSARPVFLFVNWSHHLQVVFSNQSIVFMWFEWMLRHQQRWCEVMYLPEKVDLFYRIPLCSREIQVNHDTYIYIYT